MSELTVMEKGHQEIEELARRLKSDAGFEQNNWAVTSTWASKLGHPCGERYLYYLRKDWEQMAKRNWKGRGIKGNLIHDWWKIDMMKKGYTVIQNEAPLSEEIRRKYGIGGRIDGSIGIGNIRPIKYEFKTMNENTWAKINTIDDMFEHKSDYIRAYPAQLQIYLYDQNEEYGLFVLCNDATLEWKTIVVKLNFSYVETLLQIAEKVKKAYDQNVEKNPFPRIPYGSTCGRCEFAHICLPDILNDGLEMIDNEHLEEMLKERKSLEDAYKQYKNLDEEAKEIAGRVGKNFLVGASFMVEIKKRLGQRLDTKLIPPEIAKEYQKETETTVIKFVPLDKK